MRARLTGICFSMVLFSIGCGQVASPVSPASTASNATSASVAATQLPFKGTLDGTFSVAGEFPIVSVHVRAEGNATHLGRFTLDFPHRVDLRTATAVSPAIATLNAADGDTLTTSVTGVATPQEPPGTFFIVETHVISGGTGRFAGATGSFVLERTATPPSPIGTTSGKFDGTVSLR